MPIRTTEGGSLSCQLLSATSWGRLGKMQIDSLSHILSGYAGSPQSRIYSLHFQMRPWDSKRMRVPTPQWQKKTTGIPGTLRNWGRRLELMTSGGWEYRLPRSQTLMESWHPDEEWDLNWEVRAGSEQGEGWMGKVGGWVGRWMGEWVGVNVWWISASSHSRRTQREKKRSRRLCGPWIRTQIPPEGQRVGRKFSKSKLMGENAWCLIKLPRKPQQQEMRRKKNEMRFCFQCSLV